jgi:hypothetical protein
LKIGIRWRDGGRQTLDCLRLLWWVLERCQPQWGLKLLGQIVLPYQWSAGQSPLVAKKVASQVCFGVTSIV